MNATPIARSVNYGLMLLITLWPGVAPGQLFTPIDIRTLVGQSQLILVLEVTDAETHRFHHDGAAETCGIAYKADVRKSVRGEAEAVVDFRAPGGLVIGGEYLVFLVDTSRSVELPEGVTRVPFVWWSSEKERQAYEACREHLPSLAAGPITQIFEFSSLAGLATGEQWIRQRLIRSGFVVFPPSVRTVLVEQKCSEPMREKCPYRGDFLRSWSDVKEIIRSESVSPKEVP